MMKEREKERKRNIILMKWREGDIKCCAGIIVYMAFFFFFFFLLINRVSKTRFSGVRHVEKMPHQTLLEH